MHHGLLAQILRALALLQHPSHHPCPHTLHQRRYSQKAYRQDLKLPPVFRAQVGSEATDPILCWASAVSMLQMLDGAACFAVLEVLSVPPSRERVQRRVLMTVLRARSLTRGRLYIPVHVMDWADARGQAVSVRF